MTESQLYERCDEKLVPMLEPKGFRREQPGRYARRVTHGEERISVSKGPPSKARTHFSVWISYYPDYMEQVFSLHDTSKWDVGSLTPPYLTPAGATFRPKYWGYETKDTLEKSLHHVIICLEQAAFRWLECLHDPKFFAQQADPRATLPYGFANEAAGNSEKAKAAYESKLESLLKIMALYDKKMVPEAEILSKAAKPFIFIAAKLGIEQERANYFRQKLNYHPKIELLK